MRSVFYFIHKIALFDYSFFMFEIEEKVLLSLIETCTFYAFYAKNQLSTLYGLGDMAILMFCAYLVLLLGH